MSKRSVSKADKHITSRTKGSQKSNYVTQSNQTIDDAERLTRKYESSIRSVLAALHEFVDLNVKVDICESEIRLIRYEDGWLQISADC